MRQMSPQSRVHCTYVPTSPCLDQVQRRDGPNDGDTTQNCLDRVGIQGGTGTLEERITVVV